MKGISILPLVLPWYALFEHCWHHSVDRESEYVGQTSAIRDQRGRMVRVSLLMVMYNTY